VTPRYTGIRGHKRAWPHTLRTL